MKFNSMFGQGVVRTGLDYSRTTEDVYEELEPYAVDVETGEVLNPSSRPIIIKTGEVDINERIQSYADECDIYKILENYALTGDSSFINKRVGSFSDIVDIPDNVNDFGKYVDKQIDKLRAMDKDVASEVLKSNLSDDDIAKMIEESVKAALIKAQGVETPKEVNE